MAEDTKTQKQTGSTIKGSSGVLGKLIGWLILGAILLTIAFGIIAGLLGCGEAFTQSIPLIGNNSEDKTFPSCPGAAGSRMIQLGGLVVGAVGVLLDLVMNRFLLNAGQHLNASGGLGIAITQVWTLVRDLMNLVFIGGLIWAGISMILRTNVGGVQPGKLVVQVIIAALLVNFSYFIAGAVLDASHFVSQTIYREAIFQGDQDTTNDGLAAALETGGAISANFMTVTRLGTLTDTKNLEEAAQTPGVGSRILLIGFFGLILLAVTAGIFVLFAGMLIVRFVIIVILLITSPIGIMRFTELPVVSKWGQAWWGALFSQALFPVVWLFLVASSFKIVEGASTQLLGGSNDSIISFLISSVEGSSSDNFDTFYGAFDFVVVFILATGMLYASIKIAMSIAEQAPVSVPTTGAVYGLRKQVGGRIAKTVVGTAQNTGKAISAVWNFPVQRLPGLRYDSQGRPIRGLGDVLTSGSARRAGERPVLDTINRIPGVNIPAPKAGVEKQRQIDIETQAFNDFNAAAEVLYEAALALEAAEKELADAIESGDEARIAQAQEVVDTAKQTHAVALHDTAEGYNRLSDDSKKGVLERARDKRTDDKGNEIDEQAQIDKAIVASRTVAQRPRPTTPTQQPAQRPASRPETGGGESGGSSSVPTATPTQDAAIARPVTGTTSDANRIIAALERVDANERYRDFLTNKYSQKELRALADLRKAGTGTGLKLSDLKAFAANPNITNVDFDQVYQAAPAPVQVAFDSSPRALGRGVRPKRGNDNPNDGRGSGNNNPII